MEMNKASLFMIFAFGLATFFYLDELIGALGIRAIQGWNGILSAYLLMVLNIYLFKLHMSITVSLRWFFLFLPVWAVLFLVLTGFLMILSSIIVTLFSKFLPIQVFPALFLLSIIIWLIGKRRHIEVSRKIIAGSVLCTTILCSSFLFCNFFYPDGHYFSKHIETHEGEPHYFLDIETMFPTFEFASYWLVLYECNTVAINCQEIYRSDADSYLNEHKFELQSLDNTVRVLADGEVWFEHETK